MLFHAHGHDHGQVILTTPIVVALVQSADVILWAEYATSPEPTASPCPEAWHCWLRWDALAAHRIPRRLGRAIAEVGPSSSRGNIDGYTRTMTTHRAGTSKGIWRWRSARLILLALSITVSRCVLLVAELGKIAVRRRPCTRRSSFAAGATSQSMKACHPRFHTGCLAG